MSERAREFLRELRDHWDDGYWWADRQILLVVCIGIAAGLIELLFFWAKLRMEAAVKSRP